MSVRPSRALLPVLFLFLTSAGLVILVLLVGRDPVVESVQPRIIRPGQTVEVRGRFFGEGIESLIVAGRRVSASSIVSWEDERIIFAAAVDIGSGLLVVETDRGRSQGVLVQVSGRTPRASGTSESRPVIRSLSSEELSVGSLLTIRGENFGALRRSSRVLFTSFSGDECAGCAQRMFYGRWSESTIEVHVPDGIADGELRVWTPDGMSNAVSYRVVYSAGRVETSGRIEIGLRYDTTVENVVLSEAAEGTPAGERSVVLRVPQPPRSSLQPRVQFLHESTTDYTFEGVSSGFSRSILRTVLVERLGVRTRVLAPNVPVDYEQNTPFFAYYTRDLPGLNVSAEPVMQAAASIPRRGRSPFAVARDAYDLTRARLTPVLGEARTASEALESGFADHTGYASTMAGVLRAADIPARVVTGVLVTPDRRSYAHAWVEFFVTAIGWMPADPFLGDGAFLSLVSGTEDPGLFYFGNLDAMRVAFTRGLDTYDPRVLTGLDLEPTQAFSQQMLYARTGAAVEGARLALPVPRAIGILPLD